MAWQGDFLFTNNFKTMEYIQASCFTNLDDYNCREAKEFITVPKIGDKVEVYKKGQPVYLKVVAIYHLQKVGLSQKPGMRIELHL